MLTIVQRKLNRLPLGLDIGSSGVRVAQLERSGQRFMVTKVIEHEWKGEDSGKNAAELKTERQARVARFVQSANIRKKSVVTELNPPDVECYPLDLPAAAVDAEESKIAELVRWEVDRLLGDGHHSVETRHWALPTTKVPSPTVMATAAQSDAVGSLVGLCDASGVFCQSVEPASIALARYGRELNDWNPKEVWGLLDLGATETRLILCVEGIPTVVRRVGSGGRAWTTLIADSLQVGQRAAEIQKCEQGIAFAPRGSGSNAAPIRDVATIVLGALHMELRSVATEIARSFEYALSCYPEYRAGSLVLVGGGAALRNLPEFLGGLLSVPVARSSDYFDQDSCRIAFDVDAPSESDKFAAAIGLAMPA